MTKVRVWAPTTNGVVPEPKLKQLFLHLLWYSRGFKIQMVALVRLISKAGVSSRWLNFEATEMQSDDCVWIITKHNFGMFRELGAVRNGRTRLIGESCHTVPTWLLSKRSFPYKSLTSFPYKQVPRPISNPWHRCTSWDFNMLFVEKHLPRALYLDCKSL